MREKSVIKERILEYIDYKGISKYECYKNTGITNGVLSQRTGMSEENILKFLSYYTDISTEWLLSGKGPMLKTAISDHPHTPVKKELPKAADTFFPASSFHAGAGKADPHQKQTVSIPVVDIFMAAGSGYLNTDYIEEESFMLMPSSIIKGGRNYLCGKIKGQSMSPTLQDSSYLIIRKLEPYEWSTIRDNYVYVISTREGATFVKRVKNRLSQGFLVCMSDNPDKGNYPNFNLEIDELHTVWYCEWYLSPKMPNIHATYYNKLSELEDRMDEMTNDLKRIEKENKRK
ncbi:MAG: helix-turn-helix transcriptional regulator [Tannerellaceae bacterium]|nr:helix-turn-helix transcriptional regulator [Tannerellaceae bacterium]